MLPNIQAKPQLEVLHQWVEMEFVWVSVVCGFGWIKPKESCSWLGCFLALSDLQPGMAKCHSTQGPWYSLLPVSMSWVDGCMELAANKVWWARKHNVKPNRVFSNSPSIFHKTELFWHVCRFDLFCDRSGETALQSQKYRPEHNVLAGSVSQSKHVLESVCIVGSWANACEDWKFVGQRHDV